LPLNDLRFGAPLTSLVISTVLSDVNVTFGSTFATLTWLEQAINLGTYLSARFNVGAQQAPEPGSLGRIGIGIASLAALRRRKSA